MKNASLFVPLRRTERGRLIDGRSISAPASGLIHFDLIAAFFSRMGVLFEGIGQCLHKRQLLL